MLLVVLGVSVIVVWVFNIVIYVAKVFEDVDEHGALLLNIRLVRVPYKVHVDATIAPLTSLGLTFLLLMVERVLFIKVVEVFITDLARHRGLVRRNLLP